MNWIAWNYLAIGFSVLALSIPAPWLRRAGYLLCALAAALLVLIGGAHTLIIGSTVTFHPALLAILPGFTFALDPVRAFFLIIAAAVFGLSVSFVVHDAQRYPPARMRALLALAALLYAAMITILIASAVLSFIFAWEVMSLALWALVTFDSRAMGTVRAGYLTPALSEAGALAALAGLLVPAFFRHSRALAPALLSDLTHIGAQIGRGVLPLRGLVVLHSGGTQTPVVFAMSTGLSFIVIVALLLIVWLLARGLRRHRRVSRRTLWDAGLMRLQPEMTYTATAFAAPVRVLFERLLRPTVAEHAEQQGAFVTARRHRATLIHIVDRFTLHPLIDTGQQLAKRLARMHHGRVTLYAGYIVITLAIAVLTAAAMLH